MASQEKKKNDVSAQHLSHNATGTPCNNVGKRDNVIHTVNCVLELNRIA